VFFSVLLFVSLKESIIATLSIPLAFFITFFVFNLMGSTLNFMTNFSMIVTFGIAIDTIIVILEGAAEKKKM
jgi:HAE1 family hydrophobic/amphiphilic exporter-1